MNVCKESSTHILRKTSGRVLDNTDFPAILVLHLGMRLASPVKETRTSTDAKRAQLNAELVVRGTYLLVMVQYGDKSSSRTVRPWHGGTGFLAVPVRQGAGRRLPRLRRP